MLQDKLAQAKPVHTEAADPAHNPCFRHRVTEDPHLVPYSFGP